MLSHRNGAHRCNREGASTVVTNDLLEGKLTASRRPTKGWTQWPLHSHLR